MALENSDFRTPWQLLAALLDGRGWSRRTLAIVLGMAFFGAALTIARARATW